MLRLLLVVNAPKLTNVERYKRNGNETTSNEKENDAGRRNKEANSKDDAGRSNEKASSKNAGRRSKKEVVDNGTKETTAKLEKMDRPKVDNEVW